MLSNVSTQTLLFLPPHQATSAAWGMSPGTMPILHCASTVGWGGLLLLPFGVMLKPSLRHDSKPEPWTVKGTDSVPSR